MTILAIDPGREKCGLAILNEDQRCLERKSIAISRIGLEVSQLASLFNPSLVVIGDGTNSKKIQKELLKLDPNIKIVFVPEINSTVEARKLYWKANKPYGLISLIPTSLRTPKVAIDDYAAQILGERFLKNQKNPNITNKQA